jgi:hypothetical protein
LPQLAREQIDTLLTAIRADDHLRRVRDEIEQMQRVVFHALQHADWDLARRSAEQILISELICRYQGDPQRVFFTLRAMEDGGQSWDSAVRDLSAAIHSYYTTPLGMVMRQDLFGKDAVFITPDAYDWTAQLRGRPAKGPSEST